MLITRISIKNPVFATMVMVGITVLGLFSYARLRVEQMPDVSLPFVIRTVQPVLQDWEVEMEQAAHSLGASTWMTFRRVVFPEIFPAWLSGVDAEKSHLRLVL